MLCNGFGVIERQVRRSEREIPEERSVVTAAVGYVDLSEDCTSGASELGLEGTGFILNAACKTTGQ